MRHRRSILQYQHTRASDQSRLVYCQRRVCLDQNSIGVITHHIVSNLLHRLRLCGVYFIDDDHLCSQQVDLTGEIHQLISGPVRVHQHNFEVGLEKGKIIVASVPKYDVRLLLRFLQYFLVVHSGINRQSQIDIGLVLFHFLKRAIVLFKIR